MLSLLLSSQFPMFDPFPLEGLDLEVLQGILLERETKVLRLGAGLERDDATRMFVNDCVKYIQIPIILEGNALRVLDLNRCKGREAVSMILAPNPGEYQWLFPQLEGDEEFLATRASMLTGQILVFQGTQTITALGTACESLPKGTLFNGLMASDIMGCIPDKMKRALNCD